MVTKYDDHNHTGEELEYEVEIIVTNVEDEHKYDNQQWVIDVDD